MLARFLDDNTLEKLRLAMPSEYWLPLWVSLETGLRVGDVCALRRDQLDGCRLSYLAAKTGKEGTAELSLELAAELRRNSRGRYLFPSPRSYREHLTRQAIWARVKRAAHKAGIPPEGVSPHSLRKVYAVRLYRQRGLRAAKEALQHDRTETTELYALSDYLAPENLDKPIRRRELGIVTKLVAEEIKIALDKSSGA